MKQKLEDVLKVLRNHPDNIWVWVLTENGAVKVRTSINIRYTTAVDWCIEYARKSEGGVPCFITDKDIFLGYPE